MSRAAAYAFFIDLIASEDRPAFIERIYADALTAEDRATLLDAERRRAAADASARAAEVDVEGSSISDQRPWRVLSWNLNVARASSRDLKLALLQSRGWDVIALQEVDPETFEFLAAGLDAAGMFRTEGDRRAGPDYGSALFVAAQHSVLDQGVVTSLPWPERGVWADVGAGEHGPVRVVSFHAPNAAGQGAEVKMAAYEAMHEFVRQPREPLVLAMDANSGWDCWPDEDAAMWDERVASHGEGIWRWDRFLLAPDLLKPAQARTGLRDAWRDVLDSDRTEQERVRTLRPEGPPAVTYFNNVRGHVSPLRYDHIYVSSEFTVGEMKYHYADAIGARSDHALLEAVLKL